MSTPDMEYVDSSNVEAIGYDPDEREIYVQFLSGKTYVYGDATPIVYEEFRAADSKGSYVNRVLKPEHPCREL